MDSSSSFRPVAISNQKDLSVPFLVDWILAVLLCLLVPFYFGRVFAWVLTRALDILVWRRHKIKVTIQSVKISFLGGRIFFKNLTVVTQDVTISFLEGNFTWRYWLLHTRTRGLDSEGAKGAVKENSKLPSRFLLQCDGMEAFVYNRMNVYESILKEHFGVDTETCRSSDSNDDKTIDNYNDIDAFGLPKNLNKASSASSRTESNSGSGLPFAANVFPMQIEINRGAVVVGNRNTKHVAVFSFEKASGVCDLFPASYPQDLYKKSVFIDFFDNMVELRTNLGYQNDNPIKTFIVEKTVDKMWQGLKKHLLALKNGYLSSTRSDNNGHQAYLESWKGLDIYDRTESERNETVNFSDFQDQEYARYSKILKSEKLSLHYYYDIPGLVSEHSSATTTSSSYNEEIESDGNELDFPEFGADICIFNAVLYYGPWSHKQIQDIVRLFSPIVSRDQPSPIINAPGSLRHYRHFKLAVSFTEKSTLHVPTREPSKDPDFLKRFQEHGDTHRAFGWLNVTLNEGSELSSLLSLASDKEWTSNKIYMKLLHPEIRTSVNHELLFKARQQTLSVDLGYPTQWNKQTDWMFQLDSSDVECFLLRDHINLFSDLFSDFSSGNTLSYDLFRPFTYSISWNIDSFKIFLNVNDANIINNPLDFDDNCFICLRGDALNSFIKLPMTSIAPEFHESQFEIKSPVVTLDFLPAKWNTVNEFLGRKAFGVVPDFSLTGCYTSYPCIDVDSVDTIEIEVNSSFTQLVSSGFLLRYLMNIKLNYFGDFNHFKTIEEYSEELRSEEDKKNKNLANIYHNESESSASFSAESDYDNENTDDEINVNKGSLQRTKNETDVWVTFTVNNGRIVVPESIYSFEECYIFSFDWLEFDMRYTNYYMDLFLSLSRIHISNDDSFSLATESFAEIPQIDTFGSVDGLCIHGHRMFGLPPAEETYICKWDISILTVNWKSDLNSLLCLKDAMYKIAFTYKDAENILHYTLLKPEDVTSLTVSVSDVSVCLNNEMEDSSVRLSAKDIALKSWDLINQTYSERTDLKVALVSVRATSAQLQDLLIFETLIDSSFFTVRKELNRYRLKQKNCILLNDSPFHRCHFLQNLDEMKYLSVYNALFGSIIPSISLPTLAIPITDETFDSIYESILGDFSDSLAFDTDYYSSKLLVEDTQPRKQLPSSIDSRRFSLKSRSTMQELMDNENLVIHLGPTSLKVSPNGISLLSDILGCGTRHPTERVLDYYEMNIVSSFMKRLQRSNVVKNISMSVDSFSVFIGNEVLPVDNHKEISGKVCLTITSLKMLWGTTKRYFDTQSFGNDATLKTSETQIKYAIQNLELNLIKCSNNKLAKPISTIEITMLSLSGSLAYDIDLIGKHAHGPIDVISSNNEFEWSINFLKGLISAFLTPIQKLLSTLKDIKTFEKETFFTLLESPKFQESDLVPYVISKTAFISRLSENHVRESPSWKIITRLRYILELPYLPKEGSPSVTSTDSQDLSVDSKARFVHLLKKLKAWDITEIQNSKLFELLFPPISSSHSDGIYQDFSFSFERMSLRFRSGEKSSFFLLRSINLRLKNLTKDSILDLDVMDYNKNEIDIDISVYTVECFTDIERLYQIVDSITTLIPTATKQLRRDDSIISKIQQFSVQIIKTSLQLKAKDFLFSVGLKDLSLAFLRTIDDSRIMSSFRYSVGLLSFSLSLIERMVFKAVLEQLKGSVSIIECSDIVFNAFELNSLILNSFDLTLREAHAYLGSLRSFFCGLQKLQKGDSSPSEVMSSSKSMKSNVKIGEVDARSAVFKPFAVITSMHKIEFELEYGFRVLSSVSFSNFICDFSFGEMKLMRLFCSSGQAIHTQDDLINEVSLNLAVSKLTLCDCYSNIEDIHHSILEQGVYLNTLMGSSKEAKSAILKPYSVSINADYFGALVEIEKSKLVIEFNETSSYLLKKPTSAVSDARAFSNSNSWFAVKSVCVLLSDPRISASTAKILDFGVVIKLSIEDQKRSLQVESPHSRVSFSATSLVYTISCLKTFKDIHEKVSGTSKPKVTGSQPGMTFFDTISINVLSYNMCIGWLFEDKSSESGFIIGYQSLFAAFEQPYGKLTVSDGYIAVAKGKSSEDFYFGSSIPDTNRSLLSRVQIHFWLTTNSNQKKDLFVRMNADKLDVDIITNVIFSIAASVDSIEDFQSKLHQLKNPSIAGSAMSDQSHSFDTKTILPSINSIDCRINYGGGIVKLSTANTDGITPKHQFELTSPSIEVVLYYANKSESDKPHWIRSFVNVESSHNVLFPSCVPLFNEIKEETQRVMKRLNSKKKSHSTESVKVQNSGSQNSYVFYKHLLKSFDIATVVDIGKQYLSLSCEPKAKVQADLGFGRFKISFFTNNQGYRSPLSLSVELSDIEISTRHVFSRAISSSAKIRNVYLNAVLTYEEDMVVYGHTLISGMKFYMNMKQLQDISLFLDIWSSKTKPKQKSPIIASTQEPKVQAHLEATVPKIPWVYKIVFKDISAVMDLDPSLGSITMNTPLFGISSLHQFDWSHSLTFYLEELTSHSEARLSGSLQISTLLFDSSISWPVKDQKFEAPLIKVSFSVKNVSLRLGFDFHTFIIAQVGDILFLLHNERDEEGLAKDLLTVSTSCGSITVFLTALCSANIYDIHTALQRMRAENRNSYVQTLKESNPESSGKIEPTGTELTEPLRLRTSLNAEIGSFMIHVFPSTLLDSEVLVLKGRKMNVEATTQTEQKTKTDLTWQLHDINVSLAANRKQIDEGKFAQMDVQDYISEIGSFDGDIILAAPSVFVGITTWQRIPQRDIELLYSSSFGDKVDIKWNLDPINFIREMWATHVRAMVLRRSNSEVPESQVHVSKSFFEDENIAEKIKIVDLGTKYTYIPLDEPHIEMPLLRDLGNATPPIEWFGVNRKRFPGMTHQLVVVPLQKLIHLAEDRYNSILGDNLNRM